MPLAARRGFVRLKRLPRASRLWFGLCFRLPCLSPSVCPSPHPNSSHLRGSPMHDANSEPALAAFQREFSISLPHQSQLQKKPR